MAQALYREWRPLTWSEVVGQEHVVRTLQNAVRAERLSHAYLFSGPRGTGKTSTARILAKAVNCLAESPADRPCNDCQACIAVNEGRYLDLIEIDAASNTSVDDVRDLRDRINFAPNEGRFKVYIVDEVHMLSTAAFNALLKTLEEPPPHAVFILATTEVHKIPATVLSRCQRHEFRRIPVDEILSYLEEKIEEGGYEIEPEALKLIARQATGSLRDAISLLDQLVSMGEAVTLERAQEVLGTALDEVVGDLVEAIVDGEIGTGLEIINEAIDGGIDPRQFARQVVEWLRTLLLITAGDVQSEPMVKQAESLGTEGILHAMHTFSGATRGQRTAWQPGLALELAFMDAIRRSPELQVGRREFDREPESEPPNKLESRPEIGSPTHPPELEAAPKSEPQREPESGPEIGSPTHSPELEAPPEPEREPESGSEIGSPTHPPELEAAPKSEPEREPESGSEIGSPTHPPEPEDTSENVDEGSQNDVDSEDGRRESRSGTNFQRVLDVWPELMAAAYSRDPQTQALLNSCKPLGVDEGSLVLGFQSDLLREKMEKGHGQQIISEALDKLLGAELDVRCVLLQDWGSDRSTAPSPPLPEGGMVAAALRDLGAKVIDYEPEIEAEGTDPDREKSTEVNEDEEEQ